MKRKYGALRTVATIITIVAWIVLIVGVIGSIVMGIGGATLMESVGVSGAAYVAITIILGIVGSVLSFLFLLAYAQLIHLLIDVEMNTRETATHFRGKEPAEIAEE